MEKRAARLSAEEKLLLHIHGYSKYQDQLDVPYALSQEGIAKSIGITQQRVSVVGAKLAARGLIEVKASHVQGKERKLKSYFLTQLGQMECARLKSAVERSGYVDFSDVVPAPRSFFGREKELAAFDEWRSSPRERLLVVRGIAGIGKSAFVATALKPCKGSMNIFWYRFTEWATLRDMLARLGEFLREGGKGGLDIYVGSRTGVDINEVMMLLSEELHLFNALLVFDDYQKVQENREATHFFGALCQAIERTEGAKVVVIGREVPRFYYDEREVNVRKVVRELKLDGLDVSTSFQLLAARGIMNGKKDMLYKATGGHPLALELVDENGQYTENQLFNNYLFDEIFAKLDRDEKAVLEVAAVFRLPTFPSVYLDLAKVGDFQAINRLEKKSLLQVVDGVADLHDVIRQWLYAQIPRAKRGAYHESVANYYSRDHGDTDQALVEALYHYIAGERYRRALEIIFGNTDGLIQSSYWERLLELTLNIPERSLSAKEVPQVHYILGRLYRLQGSFEKSAEYFKRAIEGYTKAGDVAREAETCVEIIHSLSERSEEELIFLERARGYYEAARDPLGMGRVERGLANYYSSKFDEARAMEHYNRAIGHFEKAGSAEDIGFTLTSLAGMYSQMRRFDDAIANYNMGLKILEELKKHHDVARNYMNLGNSHLGKGDFKEALACYERSKNLASRYFNKRVMGFALANMGKAYVQMGEHEKGLDASSKAIEILQRLEIKRVLAYSHMVVGMALSGKGMLAEAGDSFAKALEIYADGTDRSIVAEIRGNYGRMLAKKGDMAGARRELESALGMWKELRIEEEVKGIEGELSKMER